MKIEINNDKTNGDNDQDNGGTKEQVESCHGDGGSSDSKFGDSTGSDESNIDPTSLHKQKGNDIELLKGQVEILSKELAETRDNTMRAIAEAENYKKRLARENEEHEKYAALSIVEQLLPALDNLTKALEIAEKEVGEHSRLSEGVTLIHGQIMNILGKKGLQKIDILGKPFDPILCEALQMIETDEFKEGHVVEEFASGYKFNDRVLRPAKVAVAKPMSKNQY